MSSDYDSFGGTRFNAFRDSLLRSNARLKPIPFTIRHWAQNPAFDEDIGVGYVTPHFSRQDASGNFWYVGRKHTIIGDRAIFALFASEVVATGWLSAPDWNHVVAGYDGFNIFVQLNNGPRVTAPSNPLSPTRGGRIALRGDLAADILGVGHVDRFAAGGERTMDEVAIWKGRALTEAEVAADWNGGAGVDFGGTSQGGLFAYWDCGSFSSTAPKTLTDLVQGFVLTSEDHNDTLGSIVAGKIGSAVRLADPITDATLDDAMFFSLITDEFDFS